MAMSFSRSDPASPAQVADASFSTSRRGFDQDEVSDFLRMVSAEMSRMSERIRFLEREVDAAQTSPSVSARLDEETLTRLLGEETARVLSAARTSANEIRQKAELAASQLVAEASNEALRIRSDIETEAVRLRADASADAEAELEMAKQQGREMVNEARVYRERVLSELARRRELAREQIEQLLQGRDRLLDVFERARSTAVDVVAELEPIGQPDEYVNLAPTTGPVPVMVAREAIDAPESSGIGDEPAAVAAHVTQVELADAAPAEIEAHKADVDHSSIEPGAADEAEHAEEIDAVVDAPHEVEPTADCDEAAADVNASDSASDDVVVDLFARLRNAAGPDSDVDAPVDQGDLPGDEACATDEIGAADEVASDDELIVDTVFAQRDVELTPLIVAAARKLKRVLADEQNDVLDTLRRVDSIGELGDIVDDADDHAERYRDAVSDDLLLGAQAGAAGTNADLVVKLSRGKAKQCVARSGEQLTERLVTPLRDRLERAVTDADNDIDALTKKVRAVYREVKTRVIDEVLDDVFRVAYGAGMSSAIEPGTPVLWTIDDRHPACPDCDDNSLSPAVPHGEPFPTGDLMAPAHPGCRCMLQISAG